MRNNRTSRKRGKKNAASARKISHVTRTRKGWFLLVAAILCTGIIGFLLARPLWRRDKISRGELKPPAASQRSLSGPASRTQATIEALKKEALAVAGSLIEDFPDSSDPLALMGNVHNSVGNSAEALDCWEKCLRIDPNRADAYRGLGLVALRKGEYEKALAHWRKVLEIKPEMAGVHTLSARALMGLGKPKEAIAALEKELKISPGASVSYFELGQAYRQLKDYHNAKKNYEAAVEIQPDYTNAYYGLAVASARLGQKEKSAEHMEKFKNLKAENKEFDKDQRSAYDDVVSMRQSVAQTHADAGQVYRGHGNVRKAEEHWRKAATLDPKNTASRMQLVSLYMQNNKDREALQMCEQLREIEPENATHCLNVGVLYARLNQFDAALSAIERAIALDPGNLEYKRAYKLIQERK